MCKFYIDIGACPPLTVDIYMCQSQVITFHFCLIVQYLQYLLERITFLWCNSLAWKQGQTSFIA